MAKYITRTFTEKQVTMVKDGEFSTIRVPADADLADLMEQNPGWAITGIEEINTLRRMTTEDFIANSEIVDED